MAKSNSWHNRFDIIRELGKGGNAIVYHVREKQTGKDFALKELYNGSAEKKRRFTDEICILAQNYNLVEGIVPIIDSSSTEYWYTMPIAEPIIEHIKNLALSIVDIVQGVVQLSETLSVLHSKQISHRDIKPSNIYFYNGRFCLGDFGLVDFPDNPHDFTKSDKGLGAIFTIAPEMKRDPKNSDGKKADVFSLAKTIWMLLSEDERGFDGTYDLFDKSHSLRFVEKLRGIHIVELEELLSNATNNDPNLRPTIESFKFQLEVWLDVNSDFEKSQLSDWGFLNKYLFRDNSPESTVWRNPAKIINVLNIVGTLPAFNHMLFSDKGGLDFSKAELANEDSCIYIYDSIGYCFLLKPKCLYFEGFNDHCRWNYFLLELDNLSPVFGTNSLTFEYLVEDAPAHYVSAEYAQYGVYDYDGGEPLPSGYKVIHRYLRGKFLIVLKNGPYNGMVATYDGRHGMCGNDQFREYMTGLIKSFDELKALGLDEETILNCKQFSLNPFDTTEKFYRNRNKKDYKNPTDYIASNYKNWCFKSLLIETPSIKNIRFYLMFKRKGDSYSCGLSDEQLYLCVDGSIRNLENFDFDVVYCTSSRDDIISLEEHCMELIKAKCIENGFNAPEDYEHYFSIEFRKAGKPTHLFTKSEIQLAMRNADDRKDNMLVIDEDGYAKVIDRMEHRFLYPVRHESWCAGNMYVGKYSSLSTLEDNYISSLQGWLSYLQTGRTIYMDYVWENRNEKELITLIKEYY